MNKFQKIAYQLAKDDSKKEFYENENILKTSRLIYSEWNKLRSYWNLQRCLDYKNYSKNKDF